MASGGGAVRGSEGDICCYERLVVVSGAKVY